LDLLIASFSIALGALSSIVFLHIKKQGITILRNNKCSSIEANYIDFNIKSSDLKMIKAELDSLEVEKSIINSSVRKIHETFREGKLTQLEFDRLIIKYGEDLKKCDDEIERTRSIVDFYDLNSIKNSLVSVIENKIKVIDTKLKEISDSNLKTLKQPKQTQKDVIHPNFENTSFKRENLDNSLGIEAEKIKKLETEITLALEKLDSSESTKVKGISNNEILKNDLIRTSDQNVTNKRDPLRNLNPSK
jgi:hypothetical protein